MSEKLNKHPKSDVLGADGKPIKVGEMVYFAFSGHTSKVAAVKPGNCHVVLDDGDSRGGYIAYAANLTHEQPDSLERINQDARIHPRVYVNDILDNHNDMTIEQATELMALDLLARQRKVLERDRDE